VYYPTGARGRWSRGVPGAARQKRYERGSLHMHVTVEPLGNVRRYVSGSGSSVALDVPAGSKVRDALAAVGIPAGVLWNASIGGRLVYADTALVDGDRVLVFSPIGGGGHELPG